VVVAVGRAAQFVEPFLPVLLVDNLQAQPASVSTVLLLQQAAAVAGFLLLGRLSVRVGVAAVTTTGLAVGAAATGVLAVADSMAWVIAGAAAFALAAALWRASAFALVPLALKSNPTGTNSSRSSDRADATTVRARAAGMIVLASNVGAMLSAAVGAVGGRVRVMFAVQAGMTALAAALSLRLRNWERTAATTGGSDAPPGSARSGRGAFWLVIAAVAPATALMFQAFSGLAVALPESQYRMMVLINAAVLVLGQGLTGWLVRRVPAAVALAAATVALGLGVSAQAALPYAGVATVVWTLGELVVITVPSAVVAGLAPHAQVGRYVGWFQAAQGTVATGAVYVGPLIAGRSPAAFAALCLALVGLGLVGLAAARQWVGSAMRQPVSCPCGALLCVCDHSHLGCASPTPVIVHTAAPAEPAGAD
jgi:hypothetical protein